MSYKVEHPLELHGCMGLNACKGHDRYGTNECAGRGLCATNPHYCHTLNNCRGQGGCGLYGDAEEQCVPGENNCAGLGSCGTPIPAERFSTQGPNQSKSVWVLARQLFENRMKKTGRNFGPSPKSCGPPTAWLLTVGSSESCGTSGNKYCSFGLNDKNQNAQELCSESKKTVKQTIEKCNCSQEEVFQVKDLTGQAKDIKKITKEAK